MEDKIIMYLDKELSEQDRQTFETALTKDSILQKEFATQKALWDKICFLHLYKHLSTIMEDIEKQNNHNLTQAELEEEEMMTYSRGMDLTEAVFDTPTSLRPNIPIDDSLRPDIPDDNDSEHQKLPKKRFPSWLLYIGITIAIISILYLLSKV